MHGEKIGTLFHKDAHLWVLPKQAGARQMAVSARECSRRLQVLFIHIITRKSSRSRNMKLFILDQFGVAKGRIHFSMISGFSHFILQLTSLPMKKEKNLVPAFNDLNL